MNRLKFLLENPFFIIKYPIFIFKYFKEPHSIIIKHLKKEEIQTVKMRNGGTFNSFGYGSITLSLYRIWGEFEYGIKPIDVAKYEIVIDIGAHIGLFSVFLGLLNPRCQIFSFEMDANNFKNLKKNIDTCNVKNVIPFNNAVSSKSQLINYYNDSSSSSDFSIKKISFSGKRPWLKRNLNPTGKVKSITLNEIIEKNNIDCIDFLKIDCEGAEHEIIYSTTEKNLKKIKRMGGEYHEFDSDKIHYKIDDLFKYLSKYGYLKKIEISDGIGLIQYRQK